MSKVRLISVTQPHIDGIGSPEELIVYAARVSNPSNQSNLATAPRLIQYLIRHSHWSPFEMVDVCVEIKTQRAIAQQLLRHRSFQFQEFSQRYAEATVVCPVELRTQAVRNRQSSTETILDPDLATAVDQTVQQCLDCYALLRAAGVARECARGVLPLATETTLYMKGSVRSWIHYLQLRRDPATQSEHRSVADAVHRLLQPMFPNVFSRDESVRTHR